MDRIYVKLIRDYLVHYQKMVFISGARQVGKTTIAKQLIADNPHSAYLNWDYVHDRNIILNEHDRIFQSFVRQKATQKPQIVIDEIHKFPDWKNLIKGFFDKFGQHIELIITGSARLNVYKKGGDSLMGRYLNVTIHPLSVSEVKDNPQNTMDKLLNLGGFAEPFLKADIKFHRLWSQQRFEQLFQEDIRDVESINNFHSLELLGSLLTEHVGGLASYTNLASKVRVSDVTVRRWLTLLEKYYYAFAIKPWSKNVTKSLLKEPKYYLHDWSQIPDPGARFENFIACHLLKAVYYWNETGEGTFGLYYLRDKQKREVDFVVTKDHKPWFLVEAKVKDDHVSSGLHYFYEHLKPDFAFQVVQDMAYTPQRCFEQKGLWVVPASRFLEELI